MLGFFLVPLSEEEFARIPRGAVPRTKQLEDPTLTSGDSFSWILDGYCQKLIYKNEPLMKFLEANWPNIDDPACLARLTAGQQILLSLSAFDGQVKNGGITQFFWNDPHYVFMVSDNLKALGLTELQAIYDNAVAGLVDNREAWLELRRKAYQDARNPNWGPFRASYDLLDVGSFDDVYYDKWGYDENGKWCRQGSGLGTTMLKEIVKYVETHRHEFMETQGTA